MKKISFVVQIPLKERLRSNNYDAKYLKKYNKAVKDAGILDVEVVSDGGDCLVGGDTYDMYFEAMIGKGQVDKFKKVLEAVGVSFRR